MGMPLCLPEVLNANLEFLSMLNKHGLAYSLCRFGREVRKLDGGEYPTKPNALREMIAMVQMFLHENSINWRLLKDSEFLLLCDVVDNRMKERHALGQGVQKSSLKF